MAATRNILSSLRFETAAGNRACDVSSKHEIKPGDKHFAYEPTPGHRKNICMACAPSILKAAQDHLAKVIKELP